MQTTKFKVGDEVYFDNDSILISDIKNGLYRIID
jgi:hypothetical protein